MDKTALFIFLTIFIVVVSVIGGHWISEITTPATPEISSPGVFDIVSTTGWVWDTLGFAIGMATFSIAGMPYIFSIIWLLCGIFWIWLLILVIRGN